MVRNEDGSLRMSQPTENGKSKKSKGKKTKEREADWTWKEQVDMVKFTKSPIEASLLRLESADLNKQAVECFVAIMRYMGDYPLAKGQSEVDCVYTILVVRKIVIIHSMGVVINSPLILLFPLNYH